MYRIAARTLTIALCLTLAVGLTACGPSGTSSGGGASSGGSSAPSAEDLVSAVEKAAPSASWGAKITSVEVVSKFRQPVIVVRVDGAEAERDATLTGVESVLKKESPSGPWYLEVYPSNNLAASSSLGTSRVGPKPAPAPASPEGIKDWIDATYGSKSSDPVDEAWYAAIQSMSYDAGSKTVVVTTSIPFTQPDANILASQIVQAVDEPFFSSTTPTFEWVKVMFADGANQYLARNKVENLYVK